MALMTARILSGSTNGRGIIITSTTAGSGNILHTAASGTGANQFDEVYLYAMNLTSLIKLITINAGGTTSGDKIRFKIPSSSNGLFRVVPGLRYRASTVVLRGYATAAGVISMHGYVTRSA